MKKQLLLVGASTGGPSQIKELFTLAKKIEQSIVIVQHMKEDVLRYFIDDLRSIVKLPLYATPCSCDFTTPSVVVLAQSCRVIKKGGSYHFEVDSKSEAYTPDINRLLLSFERYSSDFELSVVIMTGIGKDGLEGAKGLKRVGAKIYAQDEASSPVFGMPKAVIEHGIVDKVCSMEMMVKLFEGELK